MIVALVAVVAIVAVAMLVMFMGGGARSPEGAVRDYVSGINDENFEKAYRVSTASLYQTSEEKQEDKEDWDESVEDQASDFKLEIRSSRTVSKNDYTNAQETRFQNIENWLDDEHDITVQDHALQEASIRMTDDGETSTETFYFYCVKVGGRWYVHDFEIDDDVGTEMQLGRRTGTHTSDYWVVEIISGSASQEGLTFQLQSGGAAIETVTSTEARWEPDDGAEAAVPGDGEEENNEPIIWLDNDSNSAVNSGDRIRVLRTGRAAGTYQLLVLREGSTIMNIDLTQS